MLENDVIISKISIIKNCIKSVESYSQGKAESLDDPMTQDAVLINLERAVQAAIDLANTIIAKEGYRIPATYKQSFLFLQQNGILTAKTSEIMGKMVGFRNIAVHDYQALDLNVVKGIVKNNIKDFDQFIIEADQYLKR